MLGKLIRFDIKSASRLLLPLHLALLLTTLTGRLLFSFQVWEMIPEVFLTLAVIFYIILIVCVGIISSFYFVYWFYKNLFTDEGYLMHTLPVQPWQHILSKLTGMLLWQIIDFAVIFLCIWILLTVNVDFSQYFPSMSSLFVSIAVLMDTDTVRLIAVTVLVLLLQFIVRGLSAFLCICLGQLFNKHRVIAAFVAYIILTMVVSVVTAAAASSMNLYSVYNTAASRIIDAATTLEIISDLLLIIIYAVATNYLMERKLNLE